jgi:hypothetical protein
LFYLALCTEPLLKICQFQILTWHSVYLQEMACCVSERKFWNNSWLYFISMLPFKQSISRYEQIDRERS